MTPAELLKKYGVSTNPLPFDDVVSVTQETSKKVMREMVVKQPIIKKIKVDPTPVVPKISVPTPTQQVPSSKFSPMKMKRKYTKRSIVTDDENSVTIPDRIRELFKKSPAPIYTDFLCAQFLTEMEAISFAQLYPSSHIEKIGFAHAVCAPLVENDKQTFINKTKNTNAISYCIYRKVV